ncbi:hypothetical protein [Vibrio methylphosphonaticus]|uniref:hypothetical protein n=1 Tax=Vibrio methylphosphonaticus TaxID=2946866 RepID=UPI00202A1B31|nr:hypothetical protein [Vibrio methylphosphonaticus]MCL9774290.1 hypothetical protein [Vibrio methylphosphonaticus]
MQSVNSNLSQTTAMLATQPNANIPATTNGANSGKTLPIPESDTVQISAQAKAALEQEDKTKTEDDESMSKTVQSFAHGALGMDHPDDLKEQEDDSYSAGQYVSAAVTVGALILALA